MNRNDQRYNYNGPFNNSYNICLGLRNYIKLSEQINPKSNSTRWLILTWAIQISLLILFVIITVHLITGTTCSGECSRYCFPQFTLEMKEKTREAKYLLSNIREGLKMISYVAKDLSIHLNDNTPLENIDYNDIIDTFADYNIFKFNFRGYCRVNQITGAQSCFSSNGLDILGSLIKDVGLQLGNTLGTDTPEVIATSLETAFTQTLIKSSKLYLEGSATPMTESSKLKIQKSAHKLILVKRFGFVISLLFVSSLVLSLTAISLTFLSLVISYMVKKRKDIQVYYPMVFLLLFYTNLLEGFIIITIILSEWYFHRITSNIINDIGIGTMKFGSGFRIISTSLPTLVIGLTFTIFFIIKKPYKYNSQDPFSLL